jgi:hypothetical protein
MIDLAQFSDEELRLLVVQELERRRFPDID